METASETPEIRIGPAIGCGEVTTEALDGFLSYGVKDLDGAGIRYLALID